MILIRAAVRMRKPKSNNKNVKKINLWQNNMFLCNISRILGNKVIFYPHGKGIPLGSRKKSTTFFLTNKLASGRTFFVLGKVITSPSVQSQLMDNPKER